MSILGAFIESAVMSAAGELISQGTYTVTAEQKSYIRYQCFQCKQFSIHVHTIKMEGKSEIRLWNSREETEDKAVEKALKEIKRIDELTFHEVNDAHNYGHVNEEIICPYCNARQPWSRGRGKRELDLLASPDFVHPVYYNASNIADLQRIMKSDSQGRLADDKISDYGQAATFADSSLGKTRYEIEHRMLWQHFYGDRQRLLALLDSRDGLYTLYKKVFESHNSTCPYPPETFRVSQAVKGNSLIIYSLELPKPEFTGLCYRIYLLVDSDSNASRYYTVEQGQKEGFLCGWDQSGSHLNYGSVDNPEWAVGEREFQLIMETDIVMDVYQRGKAGSPVLRSGQ